jgi:FkbM family methyltransferase
MGAKRIVLPNALTFDLNSVYPLIFTETFLYDVHFIDFDLAGKTVVDIGAFVGDTSLYYASKGAYVYAYEPNPTNYRYLLANLDLNPLLSKRIKAYNLAVGVDGKVLFSDTDTVCGSSHVTNAVDSASALEVESVSLDTILKQNGLVNPFLVKSDCKGCEIHLVKQDAISRFRFAKIEYTLGGQHITVDDLIAELRKQGFMNFRVFGGPAGWGAYALAEHGFLLAGRERSNGKIAELHN